MADEDVSLFINMGYADEATKNTIKLYMEKYNLHTAEDRFIVTTQNCQQNGNKAENKKANSQHNSSPPDNIKQDASAYKNEL